MRLLKILYVIAWIVLAGQGVRAAGNIRHYQADPNTQFSDAVIVSAGALAHTAQFIPDAGATLTGGLRGQCRDVLRKVDVALKQAGSALAQIVKLNVCLRRDEDREAVERELLKAFDVGRRPALSFVTGFLRVDDALVALDAVAVTSVAGTRAVWSRSSPTIREGALGAHVAILPEGRRVYISGQAVRDKTITASTRKTMVQLGETLRFLNLGFENVVQVKSFMQPMSSVAEVAGEIAKFFPEGTMPPQVFVEWVSTSPIEIELIVAGGPERSRLDPVEFLTPTGMKASPVFSRIARINSGPMIYVAGQYGDSGSVGEAEMATVFESLRKILEANGSDLRHMAKATYYVSNNDSSSQLNAYRPKVYDPKRPPAASKAMVRSVGRNGHAVTLDMIAVGSK